MTTVAARVTARRKKRGKLTFLLSAPVAIKSPRSKEVTGKTSSQSLTAAGHGSIDLSVRNQFRRPSSS